MNISGKATRRARLRALLGVALVALLALPGPAAADASGASLTITAIVPKRASLKVSGQPPSVLITEADLARGYVDALAPIQAAIQSNSPAGYMLVLAGLGDFVRQVRMQGLESEVQMSANGGLIPQRFNSRGVLRTTLDLKFRFFLAASARPGAQPWPMQLSVAPL